MADDRSVPIDDVQRTRHLLKVIFKVIEPPSAESDHIISKCEQPFSQLRNLASPEHLANVLLISKPVSHVLFTMFQLTKNEEKPRIQQVCRQTMVHVL